MDLIFDIEKKLVSISNSEWTRVFVSFCNIFYTFLVFYGKAIRWIIHWHSHFKTDETITSAASAYFLLRSWIHHVIFGVSTNLRSSFLSFSDVALGPGVHPAPLPLGRVSVALVAVHGRLRHLSRVQRHLRHVWGHCRGTLDGSVAHCNSLTTTCLRADHFEARSGINVCTYVLLQYLRLNICG